MSTRPIDSVFGVPDPSGDAQRSGSNGTQSGLLMSDTTIHPQSYDTEAVAHAPASEVEWTSAELSSIASTIEDLQQRLEQANSRLSSAATVENLTRNRTSLCRGSALLGRCIVQLAASDQRNPVCSRDKAHRS